MDRQAEICIGWGGFLNHFRRMQNGHMLAQMKEEEVVGDPQTLEVGTGRERGTELCDVVFRIAADLGPNIGNDGTTEQSKEPRGDHQVLLK